MNLRGHHPDSLRDPSISSMMVRMSPIIHTYIHCIYRLHPLPNTPDFLGDESP